MSRLKGRIIKAEKAMRPKGNTRVIVTLLYGESIEFALERHFKYRPEDKEKKHIIITNYCNEEHYADAQAELIRGLSEGSIDVDFV